MKSFKVLGTDDRRRIIQPNTTKNDALGRVGGWNWTGWQTEDVEYMPRNRIKIMWLRSNYGIRSRSENATMKTNTDYCKVLTGGDYIHSIKANEEGWNRSRATLVTQWWGGIKERTSTWFCSFRSSSYGNLSWRRSTLKGTVRSRLLSEKVLPRGGGFATSVCKTVPPRGTACNDHDSPVIT